MQKIKIITDSASDITSEIAKEHDIEVLGFQIAVGERSYREGKDITTEEFYEIMDNSKDIPHTAQITIPEFKEVFARLYSEGYTDVIYVSISATGSNTINNAGMARDEFLEENAGVNEKFRVHIVDSNNYTAAYGYPVIQSAIKAQRGVSAEEILTYLEDWFEGVEVYFVPYSLNCVRKSGRISAAAAFAGELLGLKPVIKMMDGSSFVVEKVRGDKNIIPKLLEIAGKQMTPQTPYIVLAGSVPEYGDELAKEMTKKVGYPPEYICRIGATIASHAGHKVAGLVIRGKNRA